MRTFESDLSWLFLCASPTSNTGEFNNSVIFLIEDSPDGSVGVIINRPLDKDIAEIPEFSDDPRLNNIEVYAGGPVAMNELKLGAFILNDTSVGSFHYGISPQKLLSIIDGPYETKPMAFLGCVCWDYKQLRDEINAGLWFTSNVDMETIFDVPPEELWRELLVREYPALSDLPSPEGNVKSN